MIYKKTRIHNFTVRITLYVLTIFQNKKSFQTTLFSIRRQTLEFLKKSKVQNLKANC